MAVEADDLKRTIAPLRLVFWGGLLCVFDFNFSQTVNGEGWTFDVLNDAVGTILIAWGVFRLGAIAVHDRYATAMLFVKVVAALSILEALHAHLIYRVPTFVSFLIFVLGLAAVVATVVFCVAMRWLCLEGRLESSALSWRMTTILFVVIYLVPLGLFYVAAAVAVAAGESFHIDLGPAGLLLLPVFFAPVVHLFISTSRMKREADELAFGPAAPPPGEDEGGPGPASEEGWGGTPQHRA